ncbi:helix-turn-helix domain-containing protein [Caballeronia fortuita]|nr:helix-turn-helix domain-containing protein [Caballeronia fortuita]
MVDEQGGEISKLDEAGDGTLSVAQIAGLLFVSRAHVIKLIQQGSLPLHHSDGAEMVVRTEDVLAYRRQQLTKAKEWLGSQREEDEPPGL